MRKVLFIAVLLCSIATASAQSKPKGGYMGKRIIIGIEGAYSPNYLTIMDALFSYNPEFGANIRFVTGRYWEIGANYNMFSLGGHARWEEFNIENGDPIKGSYMGITARKYRVKKGGLAPIGRYYEFGLQMMSANLNYEVPNDAALNDKVSMQKFTATAAIGRQQIFWNCLVLNAGVRVGVPLTDFGSSTTNNEYGRPEEYLNTRMILHRAFTPFFGLGVIL